MRHSSNGFTIHVSTHSHPKVADMVFDGKKQLGRWFQHTATRRWLTISNANSHKNSWFQHTATRRWLKLTTNPRARLTKKFQHTATRRWLTTHWLPYQPSGGFQHTATRRWLNYAYPPLLAFDVVSTHSHPKVADARAAVSNYACSGFNTQPPEGG